MLPDFQRVIEFIAGNAFGLGIGMKRATLGGNEAI